jgi:hypothetical protein
MRVGRVVIAVAVVGVFSVFATLAHAGESAPAPPLLTIDDVPAGFVDSDDPATVQLMKGTVQRFSVVDGESCRFRAEERKRPQDVTIHTIVFRSRASAPTRDSVGETVQVYPTARASQDAFRLLKRDIVAGVGCESVASGATRATYKRLRTNGLRAPVMGYEAAFSGDDDFTRSELIVRRDDLLVIVTGNAARVSGGEMRRLTQKALRLLDDGSG